MRGCETDMTESDGDWRDQGLGLQTSVSWEDMGGDILERSSEFGSVENEKDTGGCGSGSILFNEYHRQMSGWIRLACLFRIYFSFSSANAFPLCLGFRDRNRLTSHAWISER